MAETNHERIGKALELLRQGLTPFVERKLQSQHGSSDLEWLEMQYQQFVGPKGSGCVRPSLVVAELYLENTWGELFDDGTDLPAPQLPTRQVIGQRDDVEELDFGFHGFLLSAQSVAGRASWKDFGRSKDPGASVFWPCGTVRRREIIDQIR